MIESIVRIGMFVYLGRDVLVRVFYALGDGETPFRVSIFNIFLNGLLDYLLVGAFGAPGLVLATVGVNVVSMVMFLYLLDKKLGGLPWGEWSLPFLGLGRVFKPGDPPQPPLKRGEKEAQSPLS